MIRLLADENLNGRLVRGLEMHYSEIDLERVQDTEAFQRGDEIVLAVAARADRVLVTHDVATMSSHAMARISRWESMPGVVVIPSDGQIGTMIFEVALSTICTEPEEMRDRVVHLPLPN